MWPGVVGSDQDENAMEGGAEAPPSIALVS